MIPIPSSTQVKTSPNKKHMFREKGVACTWFNSKTQGLRVQVDMVKYKIEGGDVFDQRTLLSSFHHEVGLTILMFSSIVLQRSFGWCKFSG